MQEVPTQLPVVLGQLRGKSDPDQFVMIGYQLGRKQQEKIVNEILEAYEIQMKNGWQPRFIFLHRRILCKVYLLFRRSVIFCAWSGLAYDHYPSKRTKIEK